MVVRGARRTRLRSWAIRWVTRLKIPPALVEHLDQADEYGLDRDGRANGILELTVIY